MDPPLPSSMTSIHDDIVPECRSRCFTWPMLQYNGSGQSGYGYDGIEPTVAQLLAATTPSSSMSGVGGGQINMDSIGPLNGGGGCIPMKKKRCRRKPADQLAQKKPNPWGEESYSDLIAKALESAVDGRLKLNEIYQWFSDNVSYFRDRSSQEEAAGWKNSIRHNLSLHSRFMRIQNEGAGKSSWWVINPDAKPGRNPRRQRASTMDTSSKSVIDKKRRGARKKVMDLRVVGGSTSALSVSSSGVGGSNSSILSHDPFNTNTNDDSINSPFDALYRARASSTSVTTGMRSGSPIEHFDDFDFPPWVDSATNNPSIPSDIVDRTDHIRLDASRVASNVLGREIKQEMKVIKNEPGVAPPPSYQELSSVRGPQQHLQNPLLRGQLTQMKTPTTGLPSYLGGSYGWSTMTLPSHSCGASVSQVSVQSSLPIDLENLTLPDQPLIDMDMESILRHELSQTTNNQLNFDI